MASVQCQEHNAPLQRRCMLLIAAWLSTIRIADRPTVYKALVTLLTMPGLDLCLQLTAVDTLRQMVADWDFQDEQFLPYMEPLLSLLPKLLNEASLIESQVRSTKSLTLSNCQHACKLWCMGSEKA